MKQNRKVFVIGFNKCGTTSLHHLFSGSGLTSLHWLYPDSVGERRPLASRMLANISTKRHTLEGIPDVVCFSDITYYDNQMIIEPFLFLDALLNDCPGCRLIFNYRDIDSWIESRRRHPRLLSRFKSAMELRSDNEVLDYWRMQFSQVFDEVKRKANEGAPILQFKIDEDDPSKLSHFLSDVGQLNLDKWGIRHRTADLPHGK